MSVHKNFIEWYWRDRNKLCNEKLLPYQNQIFKLFSEKFHTDAEKDGNRWRKLLKSRWNECGNICNEIHLTLWGSDIINNDLRDLVNNIVNLDYNSLLETFQTLRNRYSDIWNQNIVDKIEIVCSYLEKMWKISSPHTTILEK